MDTCSPPKSLTHKASALLPDRRGVWTGPHTLPVVADRMEMEGQGSGPQMGRMNPVGDRRLMPGFIKRRRSTARPYHPDALLAGRATKRQSANWR